jgi:hypothetical protein
VIKLEPPHHTGHVLQYIRTIANVTEVVLSIVILVKVS